MHSVITPDKIDEDLDVELSLRPLSLHDFVGQERLKENLAIFIQAAKERQEALDHVLLYGPPGLGKTTLANIISRELNAEIRTTSGPVLEKAGDLAGSCVIYLIFMYFPLIDGGGILSISGNSLSFNADVGILF